MPDKIVITGGTGFIGRALSRELAMAGYEVIVLTRGRSPAHIPESVRVRYAVWDGRSADGWLEDAEGALAIVNLAGENLGALRWTPELKDRIRRSRLDAGRAVSEAVERCRKKPAVVVQASAVGYYGDRGDETLNESSAPGKGFLADVARAWEESTKSVEARGVRRVVIRTGVVLGVGGGVVPRLAHPFRLFLGGVPGDGKPWFPWIHIRDEARAIRYLIEHKNAKGVFNLTAPGPVASGNFYRAFGSVLQRPVWVPIPAFALKFLMGEMAEEMILSGQRVVPERLQKLGFTFEFPGLRSALNDVAKGV